MSESRVAMKVRRAQDGLSVIDIQGEVTAFCEDALMEAYGEAATEHVRTVLLNFEGLEYMNSGGIGLLVTLLIRAQRQGQRLCACGLNEHYLQIFELTRLNEAIGIFNDEAAALAAGT